MRARMQSAMRAAVAALIIAATGACAAGPPPESALTVLSEQGDMVSLESLTVAYTMEGIRVIQRPVYANEVVAVNLYLLGGARQLSAANAGIERLLLESSEYGTKNYPGIRTRLATGHTGSRIFVSAEQDWTVFGFRGVKQEFDSTWAVFADRLLHPALDSTGVEIVRSRMLAAARRAREVPDAHVRRLAWDLVFQQHAYAFDPSGSESSLPRITYDDLREYHAQQMVRSRMLLVIVGDVPRPQVEAAVRRTLGSLPAGSYEWKLPPAWKGERGKLASESRRLPTNYIIGYYGGPTADSDDYAAFRIATGLLSSMVHTRIRRAGLSYAAGAPFIESGASGAGLYISTVSPDQSLRIMREALNELQQESFPRAVIKHFVDQHILEYFWEHESNGAQADFLARAQLYRGDHLRAMRFMEELRQVSPSDVRRVARQYIRDISFGYLGDVAKVPEREMRGF